MHRNMADMMKAMGSGKRGPMAGLAQAMGFGGGAMPSPEQVKAMAEKLPQGPGALPELPKNFPGLPGLGKPTLPGLGKPGLGGFPGFGKKK